jgi:Domain of unknown function (DUF6457)
MTAREWIAAYASALGTPPPADHEVETILALAGAAAHASERTAAPVACWMAALSGRSAHEALALARDIEGPQPAS